MSKAIQLIRIFPIDQKNLFAYFVENALRQQWIKGESEFKVVKLNHALFATIDGIQVSFNLDQGQCGGTRLVASFLSPVTVADELTWLRRMSILKGLVDPDQDVELFAG